MTRQFRFDGTKHCRQVGQYSGSVPGTKKFDWSQDPMGRVAKCVVHYWATSYLGLTDADLEREQLWSKELGIRSTEIEKYFQARYPGFAKYWQGCWELMGVQRREAAVYAGDAGIGNRLYHMYRTPGYTDKTTGVAHLPKWGVTAEHPTRSKALKKLYPLVAQALSSGQTITEDLCEKLCYESDSST